MMLDESWERRKTCADDANVDFEDSMSGMLASLMKPRISVR